MNGFKKAVLLLKVIVCLLAQRRFNIMGVYHFLGEGGCKKYICVMFSFCYVDSDPGYWYVIWKVNTRNRVINLRITLCTNMPLWVGISWKACGLGASEWKQVRPNYACCLAMVVIFCGTWRSRGVGSVIIQREGEKTQTRGHFMGRHKKTTKEVDHWTTLPGITFLLKPQKQSLNQFFLLDHFYLHWFFINL